MEIIAIPKKRSGKGGGSKKDWEKQEEMREIQTSWYSREK